MTVSVPLQAICVCSRSDSLNHSPPHSLARPPPNHPPTHSTLLQAICVCSVANYWIMTWACIHLEASTVGLYGLVQPFSTALIAYFANGTTVAPREFGGAVRVFVSISLALSFAQSRSVSPYRWHALSLLSPVLPPTPLSHPFCVRAVVFTDPPPKQKQKQKNKGSTFLFNPGAHSPAALLTLVCLVSSCFSGSG